VEQYRDACKIAALALISVGNHHIQRTIAVDIAQGDRHWPVTGSKALWFLETAIATAEQ
jgi:hypothetical protein